MTFFNGKRIIYIYAEMVEWSIAAVLKTVDGKLSGGSNPSLCAINTKMELSVFVFFCTEF